MQNNIKTNHNVSGKRNAISWLVFQIQTCKFFGNLKLSMSKVLYVNDGLFTSKWPTDIRSINTFLFRIIKFFLETLLNTKFDLKTKIDKMHLPMHSFAHFTNCRI